MKCKLEKFDAEELIRKSERAVQAGLFVVGHNALSDSKRYVPYEFGALRNSGCAQKDGGDFVVMWGTDADTAKYARYQYYTKGLNHTTAGTCDHWFDKAYSVRGEAWHKMFEQKVRQMMR